MAGHPPIAPVLSPIDPVAIPNRRTAALGPGLRRDVMLRYVALWSVVGLSRKIRLHWCRDSIRAQPLATSIESEHVSACLSNTLRAGR